MIDDTLAAIQAKPPYSQLHVAISIGEPSRPRGDTAQLQRSSGEPGLHDVSPQGLPPKKLDRIRGAQRLTAQAERRHRGEVLSSGVLGDGSIQSGGAGCRLENRPVCVPQDYQGAK